MQAVSQIGPAWLLLSHSGFLSAMLVSVSIGFLFLITNKTVISHSAELRALSIVWCVIALVIGAWVLYAINGTWRENRKLTNPTYGNGGFIALMFIVVLIMIISFWTIVQIALD